MEYLKNNKKIFYDKTNNTSKLIAFISYLLFITLGGCTYMNESYDCPLAKTASCISMQEMDRSITKAQSNALKNNDKSRKVNNLSVTPKTIKQDNSNLRVWLAPYKDIDENQHEAAYINITVNNAQTL